MVRLLSLIKTNPELYIRKIAALPNVSIGQVNVNPSRYTPFKGVEDFRFFVGELEDRLRRLNPSAPIHRAAMGAIHPDALFEAGLYDPKTKTLDVQRWLREEAYAGQDDHHHHDVNRHDDRIRAHCIVLEAPLKWETFVTWVQTLIAVNGEDLLRIKGIVNIEGQDGPIAVHGVQHLFHDPVRLPEWPEDDRRSRMVFITRGIERGVIEKPLARLSKDR